ncbi:hypothetical protein [Microbacterium sp. BF1]|uniref:hypothetical protein n=1 Tax=Microbacterium sp. BF1 TaxID=2821146 RepID=UPI001C4DE61D|nr:hypothetical protein [Microbacterium sp. BF1]
MTISQPVHADDYVGDVTVDIGLDVYDRLDALYPGKIRPDLRDGDVTTVPGYTIFVPSTGTGAPSTDAAATGDAAARILAIVIRDLQRQLADLGVEEESDGWSLAYTWDGHGLFNDCQFVEHGFRFDAHVEVFAEPAR